jgi:hypothetical protein
MDTIVSTPTCCFDEVNGSLPGIYDKKRINLAYIRLSNLPWGLKKKWFYSYKTLKEEQFKRFFGNKKDVALS